MLVLFSGGVGFHPPPGRPKTRQRHSQNISNLNFWESRKSKQPTISNGFSNFLCKTYVIFLNQVILNPASSTCPAHPSRSGYLANWTLSGDAGLRRAFHRPTKGGAKRAEPPRSGVQVNGPTIRSNNPIEPGVRSESPAVQQSLCPPHQVHTLYWDEPKKVPHRS